MSLVVARKIENQILFLSDTRLTNSLQDTRYPPDSGTIKSVILRDDLCISFAGNVSYLEDALIQSDKDIDRVLAKLDEVHRKSEKNGDYEIEFLVGSLSPDLKLFEIKNGATTEREVSWLGSNDAFERYQEYLNGASKTLSLPEGVATISIRMAADGSAAVNDSFHGMMNAFRSVIDDGEIEEVGDFLVRVCIKSGRFEFPLYAETMPHPIDFSQMPPEFTIPHGTAEQGDYTIELVHVEPARAVGIYLLQGEFGVLFRRDPSGLYRGELISHVNPLEFCEEASRRAECSFLSGFINAGHYCKRGKELFDSGNFMRAIEMFTRGIEGIEKAKDDPSSTYNRRAICYAKLNQLDAALADVDKAISINPSWSWFFDTRGCIYFQKGELEKARENFSVALRIDPESISTLKKRAEMNRLLGETTDLAIDQKRIYELERALQRS